LVHITFMRSSFIEPEASKTMSTSGATLEAPRFTAPQFESMFDDPLPPVPCEFPAPVELPVPVTVPVELAAPVLPPVVCGWGVNPQAPIQRPREPTIIRTRAVDRRMG